MRALLFALRRLPAHPVLTILVVPSDGARLPTGLVRLADGHTGATLDVGPLAWADVQALAATATGTRISGLTAHRLCAHTLGNPRHVLTLLAETPADRLREWGPVLPAPRMFSRTVGRRLAACSERARRLVEAAAVLGDRATLATAAALADVDEPLEELDEACSAGLLDASGPFRPEAWPSRTLSSGHRCMGTCRLPGCSGCTGRRPGWLTTRGRPFFTTGQRPPNLPTTRWRGHCSASPTTPGRRGKWTEEAWALLESGRLSSCREQRERRLLRAFGLLGDAGAVTGTNASDLGATADGPLRDVTDGGVALLQGRASEAHCFLPRMVDRDDAGPDVAALTAQRLALTGWGGCGRGGGGLGAAR